MILHCPCHLVNISCPYKMGLLVTGRSRLADYKLLIIKNVTRSRNADHFRNCRPCERPHLPCAVTSSINGNLTIPSGETNLLARWKLELLSVSTIQCFVGVRLAAKSGYGCVAQPGSFCYGSSAPLGYDRSDCFRQPTSCTAKAAQAPLSW